jgi:hypothetical protein
MNSSQIKFGSFSENAKAASLARSMSDSAGFGARTAPDSAEGAGADEETGEESGGGSGHGGKFGCLPRFKIGRPPAQGAVLSACDSVEGEVPLAASTISMTTESGTPSRRSPSTAEEEVSNADLDDFIFFTIASAEMPSFTN